MISYSVSELNTIISRIFESNAGFENVEIIGELSNYKIYPSGHHYFTIKDENSQLKCVMFKRDAYSLGSFIPKDGMKVAAYGSVKVYLRDGLYQLYCRTLKLQGEGDLQAAYERLKKKLEAEGLFDKPKKSLPRFPGRIAVITSSAGAAVHDILKILRKRWPLAEVIILPVRVQGEEAPGEIIDAIRYANDKHIADLLIVGRGGGSIEDLWAFNDEMLARTISSSCIPVISAVGHEPDVTISDYVADRRAATPSNAAEISVPDQDEIRSTLLSYEKRLNPALRINSYREKFDNYYEFLNHSFTGQVNEKKSRLMFYAGKLDALSPYKVLARGYSIVSKDNVIVKSASELSSGDNVSIKFADGSVSGTID